MNRLWLSLFYLLSGAIDGAEASTWANRLDGEPSMKKKRDVSKTKRRPPPVEMSVESMRNEQRKPEDPPKASLPPGRMSFEAKMQEKHQKTHPRPTRKKNYPPSGNVRDESPSEKKASPSSAPREGEAELLRIPIVDGQETIPFSKPYMAALVSIEDSYISLSCSGFLIAPDIVATAAHCVEGYVAAVALGRHNLESNAETSNVIVVDFETVMTQLYDPQRIFFDLGFVVFDEPIEDMSGLSVAKINRQSDRPVNLDSLHAMGWGRTEDFIISPVLKEANMTYLSDEACAEFYPPWETVGGNPTQMCAVYQTGSTCFGDSGGPLFIPNDPEEIDDDVVVGVSSFVFWDGQECSRDYPAGFARLSVLTNWINSHVCTASVAPPAEYPCDDLPYISVILKGDGYPYFEVEVAEDAGGFNNLPSRIENNYVNGAENHEKIFIYPFEGGRREYKAMMSFEGFLELYQLWLGDPTTGILLREKVVGVNSFAFAEDSFEFMLDEEGEQRSLVPSFSPSAAPSIFLMNPSTSGPLLRVTVDFDWSPEDFAWNLDEEVNGTSVFLYGQDYGTYSIPLDTVNLYLPLSMGSRYTFTVLDSNDDGLCCRNGIGSYTLVYMDDQNNEFFVGSGAEYNFIESTKFSIDESGKLILPPRFDQAPDSGPFLVLAVNFDAYPTEFRWEFSEEVNGKSVTLYSDGIGDEVYDPDYDPTATSFWYIPITINPGGSAYTFTVYDQAFDGLCCDYGIGNYTLEYVDDKNETYFVAFGGEYGRSESVTFFVDDESATISSASPSSEPSMAPTAVFELPVENRPLLLVTVNLDYFPSEFGWELTEEVEGESVSLYDQQNGTFTRELDSFVLYLPLNISTNGSLFSFTVLDSFGDGICCLEGIGNYTLVYIDGNNNEYFIGSGGNYGESETTKFFVNGEAALETVFPPERLPKVRPDRGPFLLLTVNFDDFPFEFGWELNEEVNGTDITLYEENSYTYFVSFSTEVIYIPLTIHSEGSAYNFTVFDLSSDGLCCGNGNGNYTLVYIDGNNDEHFIVSGGNYDESETTKFYINGAAVLETVILPEGRLPVVRPDRGPFLLVTVNLDVYPEEFKWELNEEVNGTDITLHAVEFYTYFDSFSTEVIYIPLTIQSKGSTYIFTVFDLFSDGICCGNGNGNYTLVYVDNKNDEYFVGSGGEYRSMESTTFFVDKNGVTNLSSSPTTGPTSSLEIVPESGPFVQVTVTMDIFPQEFGWVLTKQEAVNGTSVTLHEQPFGTFTELFASVVFYLPVTDGGLYEFTVYDSSGNGICCFYGGGSYSLAFVDSTGAEIVLGSGGRYFSSESTMFLVDEGLNLVTEAPTMAPTSQFEMVPESGPFLLVTVNFDEYPVEFAWELSEKVNGTSVALYQEPFFTYFGLLSTVLIYIPVTIRPGGSAYIFTVYDQASDGLCCDFGIGNYTLEYVNDKNETYFVAFGGEYKRSESTLFFVDDESITILTASPTSSVAPSSEPSMGPTLMIETPLDSGPYLLVTVALDYDPYEIAFQLTEEVEGESVTLYYIPFGTFTKSFDLVTLYLPLDVSDDGGVYSFTVYDSFGDGLCCGGFYTIVYVDGNNDEVFIGSGTEFGRTETTTFFIDGMKSSGEPSMAPSGIKTGKAKKGKDSTEEKGGKKKSKVDRRKM